MEMAVSKNDFSIWTGAQRRLLFMWPDFTCSVLTAPYVLKKLDSI